MIRQCRLRNCPEKQRAAVLCTSGAGLRREFKDLGLFESALKSLSGSSVRSETLRVELAPLVAQATRQ